MQELLNIEEKPKRAFLVGIRRDRISKNESGALTGELTGLVNTLGLEIAGGETVTVRESNPKFGMGTGKAAELAEKAVGLQADCFIFDQDISPSQQRNWEKLSGIPAVDRQELIIRIFSSRAKTREAELQVALAELNYALPRLSHKYIDLSRQRGGHYGTRGSGETRLETDRRLVSNRINQLKQELTTVRKQRGVRRKKREKEALPVCTLVGYTNAGKSSLLNALTQADVYVEDQLFATLDATTRLYKPGKAQHGRPFLITDTVGFIRQLPHYLIDAFRSTLEEVNLADLLIHVLDASDPNAEQHFETTMAVLHELEADKIPMITVLNKWDLLDSPGLSSISDPADGAAVLRKRYPDGIPISTKDCRGLDELVERIGTILNDSAARFRFPQDRYDLAALLHRSGAVISENYNDSYIEIEARVEDRLREQLQEFLTG